MAMSKYNLNNPAYYVSLPNNCVIKTYKHLLNFYKNKFGSRLVDFKIGLKYLGLYLKILHQRSIEKSLAFILQTTCYEESRVKPSNNAHNVHL